jgi:hypothetical protein
MTTPGEMVKISFRIAPDRGGGIVGESPWAERVSANRFRIANIPVYVHGVSFRDVVFGRRRRDGVLAFAGVSLRGGHSTVWIAPRLEPDSEVFRRRWAQLRELGCGCERAGRVLAVDVPPGADFPAVEDQLEAGFVAGDWDYEIAHCGHPAARRVEL